MGAPAATTRAAATEAAATEAAATEAAATEAAATEASATRATPTPGKSPRIAATQAEDHRLEDLAAAIHAEPIQRIVAATVALDELRAQLASGNPRGVDIAAGIDGVSAHLEGTVDLLRHLVGASLCAGGPRTGPGVHHRRAATEPGGKGARHHPGRDEAGPPTQRTIVVCDNHGDLRGAVVSTLGEMGRFRVVGQAWDAQTCLSEVAARRPDLLILDVGLPGGGPGLASAIKAANPSTRIVVFSGHDNDATREAMLASGADRYVVKTGRLRGLIQVLDDLG